MDAKAEKLALFRYGLIAPLVLETLPRGELTRRAEEIAARQYDIPDSQRISVSVDTLLEWVPLRSWCAEHKRGFLFYLKPFINGPFGDPTWKRNSENWNFATEPWKAFAENRVGGRNRFLKKTILMNASCE